jgi:transposase
MQQHRHEEFIRFLNDVERAVPAGKLVEAVVDNYATHKHPKVKAWLARHPRWTFHLTPTFGSWLNAVENCFSTLTRKRIRRGSFHSIVDFQATIKRYLAEHNAKPKPFVWTDSAASIIVKLDRLPEPVKRVRALNGESYRQEEASAPHGDGQRNAVIQRDATAITRKRFLYWTSRNIKSLCYRGERMVWLA